MKINSNIGCTVDECKYHAKQENYCSLEQIQVVKNSSKATNETETDCHSFESEMN
ncbi:DUF1540 domain-containing protein [Alkalibaculum sp. M08DMB]|uniref:DUF1540 domain-containing protein n=1 Tax=Alkalibaculum sporogenes TaxID=2655001 RepID=A0A6A7KCM3_9FIRM|nr:DUF1540 domain-containing protein [Alkalibaculum sporogenes]MPW27268.1 DUF1540 domain-containing protein [Alkalibaculum sporogenes]